MHTAVVASTTCSPPPCRHVRMESCAKELHGNGGHACRAGCGGRLHGICGEVEDPEGIEMNRICLRCVGKRKKGKEKSSNLSKRTTCRRFLSQMLAQKEENQPLLLHLCLEAVQGHNNTLLPRSWVNTCCFSAYSALSSVIARLSSLFNLSLIHI